MNRVWRRGLTTLALVVCLCSNAWCDTQEYKLARNLEIFYNVMAEVGMFYVDTVDYDKLVNVAIDAMLKTLDPYTVYYPEEEETDLKKLRSGEYAGVGSIISRHGENVYIDLPYEGMPAWNAGLRCGDMIVAIDGKPMLGESTSTVSERLRGTAGSSLKIEVKRVGENKNLKMEITRDVIRMPSVKLAEVVGDSIGYIILTEFVESSFDEFKTALLKLKAQGIKGLIIDLRGNGGGLLDSANDIASLFLPYGTEIVTTKGRNGELLSSFRTDKMPIAEDLPLAILVDDETASASEVLAGAMQDLDRATIIGQKTFGKGLVQNIHSTDYNSHVKITIAKYYTPSGRCVQAIDYSNRDANGKVKRIDDSQTHAFHTKKGREVRDGGGIMPDSIVNPEERKSVGFLYYLYRNDYFFEYANIYAYMHKDATIASPEEFTMTDEEYEHFKRFVSDKNTSYTLQSTDILNDLEEMAKWEGYNDDIKDEIEAIRKKLTPNLDSDLNHFKKDVLDLLNYEIIKRFYSQEGCLRYNVKNDNFIEKALEVLNPHEK